PAPPARPRRTDVVPRPPPWAIGRCSRCTQRAHAAGDREAVAGRSCTAFLVMRVRTEGTLTQPEQFVAHRCSLLELEIAGMLLHGLLEFLDLLGQRLFVEQRVVDARAVG